MTSRLRLIGLACLRAAVVGVAAVVLADMLAVQAASDEPRRLALLIGVGAAVGCAVAAFQLHPRRSLGLAPVAATGLAVALCAAAFSSVSWSPAFCVTLGLFAGLAGAALRAVVQEATPRRLPALPIDAVGAGVMLFLLARIATGGLAPSAWWCGLLAAVCGATAIVAWLTAFVPTVELLVEIAVWPMYDIRACGPGADRIPRRGPLLIIANHTAYADPFWLSKIVPRKATPMMTSLFYDLPVIHWLMVHLVRAIRVQASSFRREAPELQEAVKVLRRGGCVLLFPEGGLRSREEQLLKPFGQGAWHILKELPQTPVVVCWIEGGWGSWASYRGGPPMKNKRLDFRRPIDIFVDEARPLDAAVLADHHTTRAHLRQACLECRRRLGLPTPHETEKPEHCENHDAPESNTHQTKP
ncbi:MAG TPA: lysophospholipid acyltransferase family protein [Gemmataceae bacterium]|nr:lysophospholipid acyltransferase family protein [Gemmataceae bacterium]